MSASVSQMIKDIIAGDRRSLARAITLCESTLAKDRQDAEILLEGLLKQNKKKCVRIGISGMPGVGKSSFIEAFGMHLINAGKNIAVLAVDPTSPITRGSILGDKTRMEQLSREKNAFIRPSPSGEGLGGVAKRTREAALLCEAAGFDFVIIETVGVGQAEYVVASMVDVFLLLQLPGSGDELQGIKKGILELADIVVIHKADGPLEALAKISKSEHERAFHFLHQEQNWQVPVILCSSQENKGIGDVENKLNAFISLQKTTKKFDERRREQAKNWFHQELVEQLKEWLNASKNASAFETIEEDVLAYRIPASTAARNCLAKILAK